MPIKDAAKKALRQAIKRTAKNNKERALVEGLVHRSRRAMAEKKDAATLIAKSVQALDKAVAHGIIKKNKGSRLKSRLMKKRVG